MWPTVSSAAEMMLEVGALTTMTPAVVAALMSTLSSPTPARAMTRSFGSRRDDLRVDLRRGAHQDRVGVGDRGEQRRPVGAVDGADLEVRPEGVDGGGRKFFGDQHDRLCHVAVPSRWEQAWEAGATINGARSAHTLPACEGASCRVTPGVRTVILGARCSPAPTVAARPAERRLLPTDPRKPAGRVRSGQVRPGQNAA